MEVNIQRSGPIQPLLRPVFFQMIFNVSIMCTLNTAIRQKSISETPAFTLREINGLIYLVFNFNFFFFFLIPLTCSQSINQVRKQFDHFRKMGWKSFLTCQNSSCRQSLYCLSQDHDCSPIGTTQCVQCQPDTCRNIRREGSMLR